MKLRRRVMEKLRHPNSALRIMHSLANLASMMTRPRRIVVRSLVDV
jgi:hypothetical protein